MPENIIDRSVWDKAHELLDEYHYKEALPLFLREAEAGNTDAWYYAGDCCKAICQVYNEMEYGPKGVEYLQRAYETGHIDGLQMLGQCYRFGDLGLEQDSRKAMEIFRQVADAGEAAGYYGLAFGYHYGDGVEKDEAEAVRLYTIAADMGDAGAGFELAERYAKGRGVPRDRAKVAHYYTIAAEAGINDARYMLGCCYRDGYGVEVDAAKAFHLFWLVGMNPNSHDRAWGHRAWVALGQCYERGFGTEKDLGKAVYWYRQAAWQEKWEGVYELGRCWEQGIVVPRDLDRALYLYGIADREGVSAASFALARYYEGPGADPEKAAHYRAEGEYNTRFDDVFEEHWDDYYEASSARNDSDPEDEEDVDDLPFVEIMEHARKGNARAAFLVGKYYEDGEDACEKDEAEAVRWYRLAADKKNACALCYLARCCKEGVGMPADEAEGIRLYHEAAECGCRWAMGEVGLMQETGQGAPQSTAEAYKNFFAAAGKGHPEAQMKLAIAFDKGIFLPRDPVRARYWYRQAASHGVEEAEELRKAVVDAPPAAPPDHAARFRTLQAAAEQGDMSAVAQLGWCYLKGLGVEESGRMALKLFRRAAKAGVADARYGLGVCYLNGRGGLKKSDRNKKRAMECFLLAAKQCHVPAQMAYARHLCKHGTFEECQEGVSWFRAAVSHGSVAAEYELAEFYLYGRSGILRDEVEGYRLLHHAANMGYAPAVRSMGYKYSTSSLVPHNSYEYRRWLRLAAEMGDRDAQCDLAREYDGWKDDLALKWYRAAARQGDRYAKASIQLLLLRMREE